MNDQSYTLTCIRLFIVYITCYTSVYAQAPANDDCLDAAVSICGESLNGDTSDATHGDIFNGCYQDNVNDLWYQIMGDDLVHTLHYTSSESGEIELHILTDCDVDFNNCPINAHLSAVSDSISFHANLGLTYAIRISTGCCSTGSFQLDHSCRMPVLNDLCENAIELNCTQVVSGDLALATFSGQLTVCTFEDRNDVWFKIIGDDMLHTIEQISNDNLELYFDIIEDSCDRDMQCPLSFVFDSFNDQYTFKADAGTDYFIRVYNYSDLDEGTFSFEHSCQMVEPNNHCEDAIRLNCSESMIGNTQFADYEDGYNGCNFENENDIWYTVIGDDMIHVFMTDSIETGEVRLEIYNGSCGDTYECITNFWLSENNLMTRSFYAVAGQNYIIRVTSGYSGDGYFSIGHMCVSPSSNDLCENAIVITCGESMTGNTLLASYEEDVSCDFQGFDDLWFVLDGDNAVHQFTNESIDGFSTPNLVLQIYDTNQCGDLEDNCLEPFFMGKSFQYFFYAELGISYLFRVFYSDHQFKNEFNIGHECIDPLPNDLCINAETIHCDESFSGTTYGATSSLLNNGCSETNEIDVWYHIMGDGLVHSIELDTIVTVDGSNLYSNRLKVEIFNGSCDIDSDNCPVYVELEYYRPSFTINTELGVDYYLKVSHSCCAEPVNFTLNHFCNTPRINDNCEGAIDLACGVSVSGDLSFITNDYLYNGCDFEYENDIWYSLLGDDLYHIFEVANSLDVTLRADIYLGDCIDRDAETLSCVDQFQIGQNESIFRFFAELNSEYLIRIYTFQFSDEPGGIELNLTCEQPSSNDSCEDAIDINCNETISGNTSIATPTAEDFPCEYYYVLNDLWYTIQGDDNLHLFDFEDGDNNGVEVFIYQSSCEVSQLTDTDCLAQFSLDQYSSNYTIRLNAGITYYIRIGGDTYLNNNEFSILHDCLALAENDLCESAETIDCQTQTIEGNTLAATTSDIYNGCEFEDENDLWYQMLGDGNIHTFTVDSISSNSVNIEIYTENCGNSYMDCNLDYRLYEGDSFTFVADAANNYLFRIYLGCCEDGGFLLSKTCVVAATNNSCETPEFVNCGEPIVGNTELATTNNENVGCLSNYEYYLWYAIVGDDMVHDLTLASLGDPDNNVSMHVFQQTCEQDNANCGSDFSFYSVGLTNSFFAESGKTYYLAIGTSYDQVAFEIQQTCREPLENDGCQGALPLACGDRVVANTTLATGTINNTCPNLTSDLWYLVQGDDMIHKFEFLAAESNAIYINIFEDDCSSLPSTDCDNTFEISTYDPSISFYAELGTSYLIRVHNPYISGKIVFDHHCNNQAPNDECSGAIPVLCSENIVGDFRESSISSTATVLCTGYYPDLWYSFVGDDMLHTFTRINTEGNSISVSIYEGMCQGFIPNCNYASLLNPGESFNFFFESGQSYLIRLQSNLSENSAFELEHQCDEVVMNNNCESAQNWICGESIIANSKFASNTYSNCSSNTRNDMWYRIGGDDSIHKIEFIAGEENQRLNVILYEDSCDNSCTERMFLDQHEAFSFFAESGHSYIIELNYCCGEYEVKQDCKEPIENDDCESALILTCDEQISLDFSRAILSYEDFPCYSSYGKDKWYSVQGDDLYHVFSVDPNIFVTAVIEVYTNVCSELYCEFRFNLRYYSPSEGFIAQAGVDYLVRILSDISFENDFIQYECFDKPINDHCSGATLVTCDDVVIGSLVAATEDVNHNICQSNYNNNPGIWYQIEGNGTIVDMQIESPGGDLEISVYSGSCDDSDCLTQNKSFLSEPGQTYFILVKAENSNSLFPSFEMTFSCSDALGNDLCENAIALICSDTISANLDLASSSNIFNGCEQENENDVWYSISGDGNFHSFSIIESETGRIGLSIYEESCSDSYTVCSVYVELGAYPNQHSFLAEIGKQYLIRVVAIQNADTNGNITFSHNCEIPQINDSCEQAIQINCGDSFGGNLLYAGYANENQNCIASNSNDLWYEIVGDGTAYKFTLDAIINNDHLNLEIFEGSCGSTLINCPVSLYLSEFQTAANFIAEADKTYLIRASANFNVGDFIASLSCFDPIVNNDCESAMAIICGDIITEDLSMATASLESAMCGSPDTEDAWYTLVGDDQIYEFALLESGFNGIVVSILKGICNSDSFEDCVDQFYLGGNGSSSNAFFAESGVQYYIQVNIACCFTEDFIFSFELSCHDIADNDLCEDAISLVCGETIQLNTSHATTRNESNNCANENDNDLWYSVVGDNQFHSFFLIHAINDRTRIEVYEGDCTNYDNNCVVFLTFNNSLTTKTFFAEAGKHYILRIHSINSSNNGPIEFDYSCAPPSTNNNCITAQAMVCGEDFALNLNTAFSSGACNNCTDEDNPDLWFSILGDGMIHRFTSTGGQVSSHLEIYTDGCQEFFECEENYLYDSNEYSESVYLEDGVAYLIRFMARNNTFANVTMQHECSAPVSNTNCEQAAQLNCGDQVITNTKSNSETLYPILCSYSQNDIGGIWYQVVGNDSRITLTFFEGDFSPNVIVMTGGCTAFRCVNIDFMLDNELFVYNASFNAELDSVYTIFIFDSETVDYGNIGFDVSCEPIPQNRSCLLAEPISCNVPTLGSTLNLNSSLAIDSCTNEMIQGPGLWYSFVGNGQDMNIEFQSLEFMPVVTMYTEDCSELSCLDIPSLENNKLFELDNCMGTDNLSFQMPCMQADQDIFCIPLYAYQYQNVSYAQLHIAYDTSAMEFLNLSSNLINNTFVNHDVFNSAIYFTSFNKIQVDSTNGDNLLADICFAKKSSFEESYTPIDFSYFPNVSDTISSAVRHICLDPGIIYFDDADYSCSDNLAFTIPTEFGKVYRLQVAGYHSYDEGAFRFSANCNEIEEIPTMSEWGLICLSLILLIIGLVSLKQTEFGTCNYSQNL